MMPTEAPFAIATSAQWNPDTPSLPAAAVAEKPKRLLMVEGCATGYSAAVVVAVVVAVAVAAGSEGRPRRPIL